jgi:hypothetical protein
MIRKAFLLAAIAVLVAPLDARSEAFRTAVFDFDLVNTSTRLDPTASERQRLAMLSDRFRAALDASAPFDVVDIAPLEDRLAQSNLQACGGCDRTYAEAVGADLSVTGVIHKMSELILNISISVRDVHTGKIIGAFNADIRGNTDKSWTRGLDWLLKHRILPQDATQ